MQTLVLHSPQREIPSLDQYQAGSVFLAGTIEMGKGEDWQPRAIAALSGRVGSIYNPRRADWDSSWKQSINDPQFSEQVNWELDHIGLADVVYFYFDPASKSPITLMELGYIAGLKVMQESEFTAVVCCPSGFWRRGNIEVICERAGIPLYEDFAESLEAVCTALEV